MIDEFAIAELFDMTGNLCDDLCFKFHRINVIKQFEQTWSKLLPLHVFDNEVIQKVKHPVHYLCEGGKVHPTLGESLEKEWTTLVSRGLS